MPFEWVSARTALTRSPERSSRPPSMRKTPSGPCNATQFAPAPENTTRWSFTRLGTMGGARSRDNAGRMIRCDTAIPAPADSVVLRNSRRSGDFGMRATVGLVEDGDSVTCWGALVAKCYTRGVDETWIFRTSSRSGWSLLHHGVGICCGCADDACSRGRIRQRLSSRGIDATAGTARSHTSAVRAHRVGFFNGCRARCRAAAVRQEIRQQI